jgi:hypothetical protein
LLTSIFIACLTLFSAPLNEGTEEHPFHVSKCEIEFTDVSPNVQIALHIFVDDLELALEPWSKGPLGIGTQKEKPITDSLLMQYLSGHFVLGADQKDLNLSFLGKQMAKDLAGIWIFLEVENQDLPREVSLDYSILTEVYDDQQNLANIKVKNKKRQFGVFMKGKTKEKFSF